MQLLTGRRPTLWNGHAAFLPATPYHENHQVQLLPGLPAEAWPRDKAIITLADAGHGALALRHGDTWLGHLTGRPDLAAYIGRIVTAGLPPTARVRVQQGRLFAQLADQDATIGQLSRLGTGDLSAIRRQLTPTGRWACQRCGRLWHLTCPRNRAGEGGAQGWVAEPREAARSAVSGKSLAKPLRGLRVDLTPVR